MRMQLIGIAIILFGILLSLVGVASMILYTGSEAMAWCIAGIACGVAGLILTIIKKQ